MQTDNRQSKRPAPGPWRLIWALLALPGAAAGQAGDYTEYGSLIITQLVSAPFPHPQRAGGHDYQGQHYPAQKHYQDSRVAVFVPKHFRETPQTSFVVHFHGWRARLERVLAKFRLVGQFGESGRNAILVVPQGPLDAPDSFGGKLEDADGFKRFMLEVMTALRTRGVIKRSELGSIALSGHSGGYHVIAAILDRGGLTDKIKEVYLFDALYGQTEKFVAWQQRWQGKWITIYTKDGGTKAETERVIADLKQRNQPHLAANELDVTAAALRQHRVIFLFTDLDHNQVLYERNNFRQYLQASGLPPATR